MLAASVNATTHCVDMLQLLVHIAHIQHQLFQQRTNVITNMLHEVQILEQQVFQVS
jgi:ABC-type uncharacterized transport system ATPase subunit